MFLVFTETHLVADGAVFVDCQIEHHDAAVQRGCGEDCAGVGRPGDVPHLGAQVVPQQRLREVFVPDVDGVLGGAGEEDAGVESVPDYGVDGGGVGRVLHEECRGELRGGEIDVPLVSAHQENVLVVRFEGYCTGPLHQVIRQIVSKGKLFRVFENKFV